MVLCTIGILMYLKLIKRQLAVRAHAFAMTIGSSFNEESQNDEEQ